MARLLLFFKGEDDDSMSKTLNELLLFAACFTSYKYINKICISSRIRESQTGTELIPDPDSLFYSFLLNGIYSLSHKDFCFDESHFISLLFPCVCRSLHVKVDGYKEAGRGL